MLASECFNLLIFSHFALTFSKGSKLHCSSAQLVLLVVILLKVKYFCSIQFFAKTKKHVAVFLSLVF